MADYLQDFSFDFEEDLQSQQPQQQQQQSLYSCSVSSSTSSLQSLNEPSTPLLYNSISPSLKQGSDLIIHDFDESFIELDISNSFQPLDKSNMISFQTSLNDDINNTIIKGSTHLRNNYKLWLSSSNY
jgi:hypothetical protein